MRNDTTTAITIETTRAKRYVNNNIFADTTVINQGDGDERYSWIYIYFTRSCMNINCIRDFTTHFFRRADSILKNHLTLVVLLKLTFLIFSLVLFYEKICIFFQTAKRSTTVRIPNSSREPYELYNDSHMTIWIYRYYTRVHLSYYYRRINNCIYRQALSIWLGALDWIKYKTEMDDLSMADIDK